jgi:DNA-directed RNA polymerase subunit M/transcription elongation factor TFIIS
LKTAHLTFNGEDVERAFFECPHCGMEYTAYYANPKIKAMQQKQRENTAKIARMKGLNLQKQHKKLMKEFEKNKKMIKRLIYDLKLEIEGS